MGFKKIDEISRCSSFIFKNYTTSKHFYENGDRTNKFTTHPFLKNDQVSSNY